MRCSLDDIDFFSDELAGLEVIEAAFELGSFESPLAFDEDGCGRMTGEATVDGGAEES